MAELLENVRCYHCGDQCRDELVIAEDKHFCCTGCKLVYEILEENQLCAYYDFNKAPGHKNEPVTNSRYRYLDEPSVKEKLIRHRSNGEVRITFQIPAMHCSSCIWLLEKLHKIDPGVISSQVNFLKKELLIVFDESKTSLRNIVEMLARTGYEPLLHFDSTGEPVETKKDKGRIIRIGVAGFCFGNIMMLSFPEYFSSGNFIDPALKQFFSYMILLLALPVFFYSSSEFFIKSYRAIRFKSTSIDIPIAIGILAIFLRSAFEIISGTGQGYFDSGSGLVFFMLIGRWFQDFTFDSLAFDRDYKSYFPIAVTTVKNGIEKDVVVSDLQASDRFLVRNNEIIPVDALLLKGAASIDYQFVTGESLPVNIRPGDTIFAGGRQSGGLIELQATKSISQSYLARIWNRGYTDVSPAGFDKIVQAISKWFIIVTFMIALAAGAFWWNTDPHKAINAFTAVLVIACPCALALSAPFTFGNILRILGRNKIYLRNNSTIENLADINTVVFDKTGTLTRNHKSKIIFEGEPLSTEEIKLINSLVRQSSHPLSRLLSKEFDCGCYTTITEYTEQPGSGISGKINNISIRAGNSKFICGNKEPGDTRTKVYISINNVQRGYFVFSNSYREGIKEIADTLSSRNFKLAVLTGDNENERDQLNALFSGKAELNFNQTPEDKLEYIKLLQRSKDGVMMVGDGLNDAGALLQSDVGLSISENTNTFSPASDGIIESSGLQKIPALLSYSKSAVKIIIISFIISLLYNIVGLSYAVTGTLSPLIAAILMPISTISLVLFTVFASTIKGRMLGFR
jgi:Cu+-exporting ATPase